MLEGFSYLTHVKKRSRMVPCQEKICPGVTQAFLRRYSSAISTVWFYFLILKIPSRDGSDESIAQLETHANSLGSGINGDFSSLEQENESVSDQIINKNTGQKRMREETFLGDKAIIKVKHKQPGKDEPLQINIDKVCVITEHGQEPELVPKSMPCPDQEPFRDINQNEDQDKNVIEKQSQIDLQRHAIQVIQNQLIQRQIVWTGPLMQKMAVNQTNVLNLGNGLSQLAVQIMRITKWLTNTNRWIPMHAPALFLGARTT